MTNYITTKDAATRLINKRTGKPGISDARLRGMLSKGRFKSAKKCPCGQAWLIDEEEIANFRVS